MTEILPYGRTRGAVVDSLAAAERILTKLRHDPAGLVVTLSAPLVLVVAFGYIIGSAIQVPGGGYREYLIPGLFVLIAVSIIPPLVTMSRDAQLGVVDRYRSMPISRTAVPFGQALATSVYGLVNFVLMGLCGLLVGWRFDRGVWRLAAALGLLLLVQFAMTWVGLYLGLVLRSQEAAGQLSLVVLPIAMVSNLMVPTGGMPTWLRTIAEWNPVSALGQAVRELCGNPTAPDAGAWPLAHPITATLLYAAVILAIFVPATTRRFARRPARNWPKTTKPARAPMGEAA
ncbi:ABC transporter permease [Cryptosporangium aurantiacum]|uniref:Transport permease protein n=1 Tax=Cryptosporangium aurantiacum TaxID=134849 RepID=A0A1M7JTB2_9ACTN|nr:ABC transporter permease [Cryptosporangium aurantiacum]SHM56161.1 ABC-2 type transport system permease protein [Cryptosporangium aurantiacum]